MVDKSLTTAELDERLDELLDPVLSSRRTAAGLAGALAMFGRRQQDFTIEWVDIVSRTNPEMAYQLAARLPEAFGLMDLPAVEEWIIHCMDVYDRLGLYPGCAAVRDVRGYAATARETARSVSFEEAVGVVGLFIRGLSGRNLKIVPDMEVYTDTDTLFLPSRISLFASRADNHSLYKAIAAHLWAQTWFGTFSMHAAGRPGISQTFQRFPDPERAVRLFHALETVRLDARIATELPGLHREMRELQAKAGRIAYPARWHLPMRRLRQCSATVLDTYDLLQELWHDEMPAALCYQGRIFPERVEAAVSERVAREKEGFRFALAQLARGTQDRLGAARNEETYRERGAPHFGIDQARDPQRPDRSAFELSLDGNPIAVPVDVRALIGSIIQDLGAIPEDYLVPAGDGGYRPEVGHGKGPGDIRDGAYQEKGAFLYNEWDYRRRHYRKNWCVVREIDAHPVDGPFVQCTLDKYSGALTHLRKTFEALRGEDRVMKRQLTGDDIDFDALVEAHADMKLGMEMSQRLFTKLRKLERNIAVMFMVDMSGSTKGWINEAEREALVLLCEALQMLGDRYAIYGFSGTTRMRCEIYRVKRFEEPYSDAVRRRITGMMPQDYTRMGAIIRHLTRLFRDVEARTKLLITLSDGKPDDSDGYRGEYGIEDTRQALVEAKHAGIHPFCVTIDSDARDYLPHMYGPVNYTIVDDVKTLPVKVSEIYRRLTL